MLGLLVAHYASPHTEILTVPVVVERLWRSVKYEEVCLHAYASASEARSSIDRYLGFYNARRPHSSLSGRTPNQAYFGNLLQAVAA